MALIRATNNFPRKLLISCKVQLALGLGLELGLALGFVGVRIGIGEWSQFKSGWFRVVVDNGEGYKNNDNKISRHGTGWSRDRVANVFSWSVTGTLTLFAPYKMPFTSRAWNNCDLRKISGSMVNNFELHPIWRAVVISQCLYDCRVSYKYLIGYENVSTRINREECTRPGIFGFSPKIRLLLPTAHWNCTKYSLPTSVIRVQFLSLEISLSFDTSYFVLYHL